MALQCSPRDGFRPALPVNGGGVEIVYAPFYGVVYQSVYGLLIYRTPVLTRGCGGRPAHAAVPQQGDLPSGCTGIAGCSVSVSGAPSGEQAAVAVMERTKSGMIMYFFIFVQYYRSFTVVLFVCYGPSHTAPPFACCGPMAICVNSLSGAAPCQCTTSGAIFTTSPGRNTRTGFPFS